MLNLKNKICFGTNLFKLKSLLTVAFSLFYLLCYAEGTKQLRPNYNDNGHIVVMRTSAPENNFASYFSLDPSPDNNTLRFRIANTNERIYLGFGRYKIENSPMGNNSGDIATHNENFTASTEFELRFRIRRPDGTVLVPETTVPTTGVGYIGGATIGAYNRAVAGPAQLVGLTGYNAFAYTPDVVGDYYIEFVLFNVNTLTYASRKTSLQLFDLSIAASVGRYNMIVSSVTGAVTSVNDTGSGATTAINGRLWSRAWRLSTGSNYINDSGLQTGNNGTTMGMPDPAVTNNLFAAKMYVYAEDNNPITSDAVVTELDFNGMDPFGFSVICTRDGVNTNPDFILSKRSQYGLPTDLPTTPPPYRIFLQNPDPSEFPNGQVGCLQGISVKQCALDGNNNATAYCINITAQATGAVDVLIDLWNNTTNMPGSDGVYTSTIDNPSSRDVLLSQQILINGTTCVSWDGLDALGNEVADGENIAILVAFRAGLTNLPINDVENHNKGFRVSLVRPNVNACGNPISLPKMYWDDTNVQANFGGAAPNNSGYTFVESAPPFVLGPGTFPPGTAGVTNLIGCDPNLLAAGEGCHRWVRRGKNSHPMGYNLETMNTWWYVADEKLNTVHINDKSLFDIISSLGGSGGACIVNDFGEITIEALYSTAKFADPSEFVVTMTPDNPSQYSFIQLSRDNNANTPAPPMGKGRIRLVYRLDVGNDGLNTGATVPTVGFRVRIVTNQCGTPQEGEDDFSCSIIILPIELSSFTGRLVEGQLARLEWTTAREQDNKGFFIERSIDGRNFTEIDFIQSKGNTVNGHRYSYLDRLPYRGTFYYRLRQVDLDGKETYSKIIPIKIEDLELDFMEVFYHSDDKVLQVKVRQKTADDLQITVYNMLGVEVHCLKVPMQNNDLVQTFSIPINIAHTGAYIVEVKDSKNIAKKKVVMY
ncbi:Por secretion system C-terminal sorting domain-containing protein [Thermoflexibacter ruber]|uniref:Por secretion system C-terminal sorting domain-containing protein n=1 Tax=Thermoflexibacter ruber TaxID=1003 RepID=A0A1I2DY32_9BACT|nr:Por secretion system C-terminal sorting domain-containing protein [Thermoflexibacter ruber]